jgi:hypothetical protein
VNFGVQAASAAPNGLPVQALPTLTFFTTALCWCARTMVLSIMAYSLSASFGKASEIRFDTPPLLEREWGGVHYAEVSKALGWVAPRNAWAAAVEHRIDEQPVVSHGGSKLVQLGQLGQLGQVTNLWCLPNALQSVHIFWSCLLT